jgi:hypothetical protein
VRGGGVYSPAEFKGISLELTVKWCQSLVWCGVNYEGALNLLKRSAGGTWSWPDVIHPLSLQGIASNGADPAVLYQMVLLWRLILIHEVGDYLYILPGIFNCGYWDRPQLEITDFPTAFGQISLLCKTIGAITEINLKTCFKHKPTKIRLKLSPLYCLSSADASVNYNGRILEADPEVQIIRLKKSYH